jgi:hypothetical protein
VVLVIEVHFQAEPVVEVRREGGLDELVLDALADVESIGALDLGVDIVAGAALA